MNNQQINGKAKKYKNKDNEKKEVDAIYIQIIVSTISILAIMISISLLYNRKQEIKGEKTLFNAKQTQKISEFNRDVLLIIAVIFLLVNYQLYSISKEEGEPLNAYRLQIIASYFSIIAALIALYVVRNPENRGQISDVENPII